MNRGQMTASFVEPNCKMVSLSTQIGLTAHW